MIHDGVAANGLLQSLDAEVLATLGCVPIELQSGQLIQQCGAPELYAFFPVTAVVSLVSTMASGDCVEVATVGREGMTGLAGVLASSDATTDNIVQVGGICMRTTTAAVRSARAGNGALRTALDRYTNARMIQVARVAACNRLHPIGSRLARWLLGIHDRADGDTFRLRQQSIADMLGVHRPTIALELQRLRAAGAITYRGRQVTIANRRGLESIACECHDALHREQVKLLRPMEQTGAVDDVGAALLREQEAREQADAASRAKDDLLAMVSHELRTPLHAILGWCTIAKTSNRPGEALAVIERNARVQMRLVEDLLDSARMNADTLRIAPATVDPKSILEAAIETVRPAADAKQITVRLNVFEELPPLVADGDRLRQVLVNVLMNAVKFTNVGGSVDADASSTPDNVEVEVRDTGRGISPQVLPHVFERFRQGDARGGARRGLGLGLSIARALVELHGGTIRVASAGEGQGTTCTVSLPKSTAAVAGAVANSAGT